MDGALSKYMDPIDVHLLECDIDDPCVHIELENLPNYSRQHLMQWLVYRGDCLRGIHTLKDVKSSVEVLR